MGERQNQLRVLMPSTASAVLGLSLDLSGIIVSTGVEPSLITLTKLIGPFLGDLHWHLRWNTLRAYRADLVIAAAHFSLPLEQISPKQVEAFLADPVATKSTARRRSASLRRVFQ